MKKFFIKKFIKKKKNKNKKLKNKRYCYKISKLDNEKRTTLYDLIFEKEIDEEENLENNNSIDFNKLQNTYVTQEFCPVNLDDNFENFDTVDSSIDSTNVSKKE